MYSLTGASNPSAQRGPKNLRKTVLPLDASSNTPIGRASTDLRHSTGICYAPDISGTHISEDGSQMQSKCNAKTVEEVCTNILRLQQAQFFQSFRRKSTQQQGHNGRSAFTWLHSCHDCIQESGVRFLQRCLAHLPCHKIMQWPSWLHVGKLEPKERPKQLEKFTGVSYRSPDAKNVHALWGSNLSTTKTWFSVPIMKCGKWNVTRKLRRRQRVQLEILTLSKVLRIECLLLLKGDQAKGRSIQNPNKPKTQKHAKKKGTANIPIRVSISLSSYRHSFHSLTHFLKLWLEVTSKSTESTGEKAVLRAYW